ncbi:Uncharacterised protein [uncultured archaeon]|nr:Uncharacterised protein [uncultured archaeon]
MIDEQDYNNWRYNIEDTLNILRENILNLEKKVKLLEEKNNGWIDNTGMRNREAGESFLEEKREDEKEDC